MDSSAKSSVSTVYLPQSQCFLHSPVDVYIYVRNNNAVEYAKSFMFIYASGDGRGVQQNAFLENDQYSSFDRQARLLALILRYKDLCDAAIARGADIWKLYAIAARAAIGRAKTVPAESYKDVYAQIEADTRQNQSSASQAVGNTPM